MTLSTSLVEKSAGFLEHRMSRRNVINRSAFVGSAVAVGAGLDLALKPGTAYGQICECGNAGCDCGSNCCAGFTEFCCAHLGYNYCPDNTMMGGWWMADNSSYCDGPRYYMDCNATCACDAGCSDGFPFCEPGCDLTEACGCGPNGCDSFLTELSPVPLWPVQPGRPVHGAHRLPRRRLCPAMDDRPDLHHRRRRRQRNGRAERRLLDADATVPLIDADELPDRRHDGQYGRERIRRRHLVRASFPLWRLPERRRRLEPDAQRTHCRRRRLPSRGLLVLRHRRWGLRLWQRALQGFDGRLSHSMDTSSA